MNGISLSDIETFRMNYENDPAAKALTAAMAKTPMADLAFVPTEAAKLAGSFEVEIKTHGITAQEKSGRCWLFAALNILREEVIKKTGLTDFALSGNYLSFYDKFEKANNVLSMAVERWLSNWLLLKSIPFFTGENIKPKSIPPKSAAKRPNTNADCFIFKPPCLFINTLSIIM